MDEEILRKAAREAYRLTGPEGLNVTHGDFDLLYEDLQKILMLQAKVAYEVITMGYAPSGVDSLKKDVDKRYEARYCSSSMPTDCCDYAVVDLQSGIEVCRVWNEDDCRKLERLLNSMTKEP